MSEGTTPTPVDRSMAIAQEAADKAYRARVSAAILSLDGERYMEELVQRRADAGIDVHRWFALRASTRSAASPEEFQAFARVLRVSPRWLAIGFGDRLDGIGGFQEPPVGWETFGSHVDRPDEALEFSAELDEVGEPLWERGIVLSAVGAA